MPKVKMNWPSFEKRPATDIEGCNGFVRQYEECPVCDAVVILAILLFLSLSVALLCTSFE